MAELERMYISQERERHGEENDGREEDGEARLSIRLDISKWIYYSILNRDRVKCQGAFYNFCSILTFKSLSLTSFQDMLL